MMTRILKIDARKSDFGSLAEIIRALRNDGIIIYPTDTFYGLGASCFSKKAVEKIYVLKNREKRKPLSIVIADRAMLDDVVSSYPPLFQRISEKFWPGPLTLIMPASKRVPSFLQSSEKTIGVRLPDHDWLRELIHAAGFPLTATSANLSGEKEVSDAFEAVSIFEGLVDLIVDGGATEGKLPSTVLDLTQQKPVILREGAVLASSLLEMISS